MPRYTKESTWVSFTAIFLVKQAIHLVSLQSTLSFLDSTDVGPVEDS